MNTRAHRSRENMEPLETADTRFEIREELARDPRFVRRRAFDRRLECEVLLEQPGPAVADRLGTADGARAMREARMLARVRHPRVIRLREVVELDGLPTLVLEPVAGDRLDVVLARQARFAPEEVVRLGRQLAQAAHAVHAEGIVHRGIAPENVVIDPQDGGAILAGFTFAKPIDQRVALSSLDHRLREEGGAKVQGLPLYAAPEQMAGQRADHRADVFALGCLLYRCATGREAFTEDTVSYEAPPPPRGIDRAIPQKLSDAILACIARSPTARYPNMLAVDEALAALEAGPAADRRGGRWIGLAAAAAAAIAVVGWTASRGEGRWAEPGEYDHPTFAMRGENAPNYDPTYRESRAILVGINYAGNPAHEDLNEAENDVAKIGTRLAAMGWTDEEDRFGADGRPEPKQGDRVFTLRGERATRRNILDLIDDWGSRVDRDGQLLVYLAGHGKLDERDSSEGYFIPFDGTDKASSWVFLRELTTILTAATGPKHVLVALDCCHSGAAIPTYRGSSRPRKGREDEMALDEISRQHLRRRARVLLTSALAHEKAADRSPFAAGFLSALEQAAAGTPVTTSRIYAEIHSAVVDQEARQCCWRANFHTEDTEFVFLPRR
jgi:hypothetical protein